MRMPFLADPRRPATLLCLALCVCTSDGDAAGDVSSGDDLEPSPDATDASDATDPSASSVTSPDPGATGSETAPDDTGPGDDTGDTGDPPPPIDCGDGTCSALETCSSCASDCGECPSDCADAAVLCVDASGVQAEFATIQDAADAATPGDTVLVFAGSYEGFDIAASGEPEARISYRAADDGVVIDIPSSGDGCSGDPTGICIAGSDELAGVHDVVVEGFTIVDMGRSCVASHSANPGVSGVASPHLRLVLRGLRCERAGHEGLYLSEVGASLVEGNEVVDAGANGEDRGHGIYMANAGCDDTVIRGNVIHWDDALGPAEGAGIHFNGDLSVEGDGGGDGVITGLVVEGNTIWGSSHNGFNMDGVRSSRIADNVVFGNARNALVVYAIDAAGGAADLQIVGNTFVVPDFGTGAAIRLEQDEGGHVIFDNILVNQGGGPSISLGSAPFARDYNALVDVFAIDEEDVDVDTWQAGGHDTHSIVVDGAGLFVGPTDFHLVDGAAPIDAGIDALGGVAASAIDLEGTARPQGAGYDIGAYER